MYASPSLFGPYKILLNSYLVSKLISIAAEWNYFIHWYLLLYKTNPILSENGDYKLGKYVPQHRCGCSFTWNLNYAKKKRW